MAEKAAKEVSVITSLVLVLSGYCSHSVCVWGGGEGGLEGRRICVVVLVAMMLAVYVKMQLFLDFCC